MERLKISCGRFLALMPILCMVISSRTAGQVRTDTRNLERLARRHVEWLREGRTQLYDDLVRSDIPPQSSLNADPDFHLMYMDRTGLPVFYRACNLDAARTIRTDLVWPDSWTPISLDGSSTEPGELGIWDTGGVYEYHVELAGRVTLVDDPPFYYLHATLVAGTMIAEGIDPRARGMSYAAPLSAYDLDGDIAEMAAAAAAGMKVSNHSYTVTGGWDYVRVGEYSYPAWFGDVSISQSEDYRFGFYGDLARQWDEIAYAAPYYTIVISAGNDRDDAAPEPDGGHYVWDGDEWIWSTAPRDPDGGASGYDCIMPPATAKNVITVGAVEDIPEGWSDPSDVVMSVFSSWGPTDDGRIKPDITANGVGVYSTSSYFADAYQEGSGTSFSAPSVAGSLNLLVQHFKATHGGAAPRAATVKAVMIQTADEAGPAPGPDYSFGWGLMNTFEAALLIGSDEVAAGYVREEQLPDGCSHVFEMVAAEVGPLRVTLAWTDPPGAPSEPAVDRRAPALVNDLDLRLEHSGLAATYFPYVLDPDDPDGPAATGDNTVDNVEQITILNPAAGVFRVIVSHKGTLSGPPQAYSLAASRPLTPAPDTTYAFTLDHVYPNPTSYGTWIHYSLPTTSVVNLRVYDAAGRLVTTLVSARKGAGPHSVFWIGTGEGGSTVAPGVYFCRFDAGPFEATRKIVLIR